MAYDTVECFLHAALRYAELDYPVFPCWPGTKRPIPENGFHGASTDEGVIETWWKEHPRANVAIATERLVVIDRDGPNNPWLADDPERAAQLAGGALSLTPRGGCHGVFRQPPGKNWRCTASKLAPKVDTRADGGYILVAPSVFQGNEYRWAEGMELDVPLEQLPEPPDWLTVLLDAIASGNGKPPVDGLSSSEGNLIPEGQRNSTLVSLGGAMRRVGMGPEEILAALAETNARRCKPPLDPREVERIAASVCRYEPDSVATAVAEHHWEQDRGEVPKDIETTERQDPGPLPAELLRVPGFVSQVMDHCLETAPYPNVVLSFCGALVLQAFLAGRKVRDAGDNRTNLYLLGLAHSAAGKDWPRKVNTRILHEVGLTAHLGDRFASGEGVQDSLFIKPCMLFQTDEIDGMLQSINRARDARYESIMGTLLTLYSSANSVFPMRRKAGKEYPGAIDQPCLVVFGTAIPNHYYEALSKRMLTNGFFARMLILEGMMRPEGQEPSIREIPRGIMASAKWWADFRPGTGNLENWHPVPVVVPQTEEAKAILVEARRETDAEYAKAEGQSDPVGTTVWGRVNEHIRKLALLHAVSENHERPSIGKVAAEWAVRLVMHQARRMLFQASAYVAENPFHAECLKFLQKLRDAPERTLPHSVLLKRMKTDAKAFQEIVTTLIQGGDITLVEVPSAGRPHRSYRIRGETSG
jgi:hypothetical protein